MVLNKLNSNLKAQIKKDVEERKIEYLVHFTAIENIPSILSNGIHSVYSLDKLDFSYDYNDEYRLDGYENAISLSVMFPNYSMFYKYRIYNKPPKDMAVLSISPSILWEKECAFYYNNAASSDFNNTSARELNTYDSWCEMFCEEYGENSRKQLRLPSYYTTNPQAEILCFDTIDPNYILDVCFENQVMIDKYKHILPNKKDFYYIFRNLYAPRFDYAFWKKN